MSRVEGAMAERIACFLATSRDPAYFTERGAVAWIERLRLAELRCVANTFPTIPLVLQFSGPGFDGPCSKRGQLASPAYSRRVRYKRAIIEAHPQQDARVGGRGAEVADRAELWALWPEPNSVVGKTKIRTATMDLSGKEIRKTSPNTALTPDLLAGGQPTPLCCPLGSGTAVQ